MLLSLPFNIILTFLARAIKQEKSINMRKDEIELPFSSDDIETPKL